MQQVLIHQIDLTDLKSDLDKLDIDKFKNVPSNLSNLKSKVYKLDGDKIVPVTANLTKRCSKKQCHQKD